MSEIERVAIVTGAAGCVGRAITRGLLAAGIKVASVGRDREPLEALAATARGQEKAAELLTIQTDLTNDSASDEITKATRTRYGRIDILVNNAGSARAQTDQTAGSAPSSSGKSRPISGAASSRCTRRHHGRWRTLSCPK